MKLHTVLLPVACAAAVLTGCATAKRSDDKTAAGAKFATGCSAAVVVVVSVDPAQESIEIPEPICVNTDGVSSSVEWQLPPGYAFSSAQPCVNIKSATTGGGSQTPVASGASCRIGVSAWGWWTITWVYGLSFQSAGVISKSWTCDPTIVNSDFGGFAPGLSRGPKWIKCSVAT